MVDLQIDLSKDGLEMIFRDYAAAMLEEMWSTGKTVSSLDMTRFQEARFGLSRATIINTLNRWAKLGIVTYAEITCKGGYKGLYTVAMSRSEFWNWVKANLNEKMSALLID